MDVQKREGAYSLTLKFAVEKYGVSDKAVFITPGQTARGTKFMPNSESVEFDVVLNNGNQETHLVAVDVANQDVVLLY